MPLSERHERDCATGIFPRQKNLFGKAGPGTISSTTVNMKHDDNEHDVRQGSTQNKELPSKAIKKIDSYFRIFILPVQRNYPTYETQTRNSNTIMSSTFLLRKDLKYASTVSPNR